MRTLLGALSFCLLLPVVVEAKPSVHSADAFAGDRWVMVAQGAGPRDVTRSMRRAPMLGVPKAKRKKNYRPAGYPVVGSKKRPRRTLIGGLIREIRKALPRRGRGEPITFQTARV